MCKICGCYSVTFFLKQTPTFEWCEIGCEPHHIDYIDTCLEEFVLLSSNCAKHSTLNNQHNLKGKGGGGYECYLF